MVMEAAALATINVEDLMVNRTSLPVSFIYTAGGASWATLTNTFNVVLNTTEQRDIDGLLCYELIGEQDPVTGPLTIACTE